MVQHVTGPTYAMAVITMESDITNGVSYAIIDDFVHKNSMSHSSRSLTTVTNEPM